MLHHSQTHKSQILKKVCHILFHVLITCNDLWVKHQLVAIYIYSCCGKRTTFFASNLGNQHGSQRQKQAFPARFEAAGALASPGAQRAMAIGAEMGHLADVYVTSVHIQAHTIVYMMCIYVYMYICNYYYYHFYFYYDYYSYCCCSCNYYYHYYYCFYRYYYYYIICIFVLFYIYYLILCLYIRTWSIGGNNEPSIILIHPHATIGDLG
jgi:hypothetical protein